MRSQEASCLSVVMVKKRTKSVASSLALTATTTTQWPGTLEPFLKEASKVIPSFWSLLKCLKRSITWLGYGWSLEGEKLEG
jgi:hypothetical protein